MTQFEALTIRLGAFNEVINLVDRITQPSVWDSDRSGFNRCRRETLNEIEWHKQQVRLEISRLQREAEKSAKHVAVAP